MFSSSNGSKKPVQQEMVQVGQSDPHQEPRSECPATLPKTALEIG